MTVPETDADQHQARELADGEVEVRNHMKLVEKRLERTAKGANIVLGFRDKHDPCQLWWVVLPATTENPITY